MKYSTQFKKVIEVGELGVYELGWLDIPENNVGRRNMYEELDRDITTAMQNIGEYNHSSFAEEKRARLSKAQAMLYRLGNKLVTQGAMK